MRLTRLLVIGASCALATPAGAAAQALEPRVALAPTVALAVEPDGTVRGYETEAQANLVKAAFTQLKLAVNSTDFQKAVLAAQYEHTRFRESGPNGKIVTKTKQEILAIILKGVERDGAEDEKMKLDIRLKDLPKGTVGSTRLGSEGPINTSFWFVDKCVEGDDTISMAGHLAHEWMHKAGFPHYPNNSARGDVPYVIGNLARNSLRDKRVKEFTEKGLPVPAFDRLPGYLMDEANDEVLD